MNDWRAWSEQYEPHWPLLELNALAAFTVSRAYSARSHTITEAVVSNMIPIVGLSVVFVENACIIFQADWKFGKNLLLSLIHY